MESFAECHYCHKSLTSPLELVCQHSYCSECLTKEVQNDKVICPVCSTETSAPAASFSTAKQDKVASYVIGLHRFVHFIRIFKKHIFSWNSGAPYSSITDDSPGTTHAICPGCKKSADLRTCFHCDKALCAECRTKHCDAQKKDVDQSMQHLTKQTAELVVLARMYHSFSNLEMNFNFI
jgi:hypothetical protein